jgi:hypothetical protein
MLSEWSDRGFFCERTEGNNESKRLGYPGSFGNKRLTPVLALVESEKKSNFGWQKLEFDLPLRFRRSLRSKVSHAFTTAQRLF